jgi:hypothetical protein
VAVQPGQIRQITVADAGLSDSLPQDDRLGFTPYVQALEAFLMSAETKGPLTVSVEGPWGVGKSSFMKLLRDRIEKRENAPPIVNFNAWRHESSEALWAAFALAVISQLTPKRKLLAVAWINMRLLVSRINWSRGWWPLTRAAALLVAFVVLAAFAAFQFALAQKSSGVFPVASALNGALGLSGAALAFAAVAQGVKRAREVLGNPLALEITKYVEAPRYGEKLEFLDNFDDDLKKIITAYVGREGSRKVFVFIDDLDRTEAMKAASVMQAINLLMSAEGLQFIFILGIDRRAVAASLAANAEKLLPYLTGYPEGAPDERLSRAGLQYGYSYLEKFIQIPFAVPRPSKDSLPEFIASLDGRAQMYVAPRSENVDQRSPEVDVAFDTDSEQFREIVKTVAWALDYNPRRLKQFVNVFRLRAYIASKTGLFVPDDRGNALTLEQLAKFTAASLRWPEFAFDLAADPLLLGNMLVEDRTERTAAETYWRGSSSLLNLLRYQPAGQAHKQYDMSPVDVPRLLEVSPAYAAVPGGTHGDAAGGGSAPSDEHAPHPPPPIDSSLEGSPDFARRKRGIAR